MELIGTIGGWGAAIIIALIALMPRKGTLENARIDQLQEDLAATRTEVGTLRDRVDAADRNADKWRRRDAAWNIHYLQIVRGVEAGTVPPWPPLPAILEADHD